jgi:hypothetical protein
MELNRETLRAAFGRFVVGGDGVVIGAPGVGKTHLFIEFARTYRQEQRLCLYLPIDRLGIETENDLKNYFKGSTDPVSYLRNLANKRGGGSGVLLIDALDAARSERARAFFLEFAREVVTLLHDQWTVVISVRTYDAQRSGELEAFLPPAASDPLDLEFRSERMKVRHFVVPELRDDELDSVLESIPDLARVTATASSETRLLLHNPFNLWLAERLVGDPALTDRLTAISSEVQLLNLFWRKRVEGASGLQGRVLLTKITRAMVRNRTLSLRIEDAFEPSFESAWHALLNAEILEEERNGQRVVFSHNILFDYAVSRLLIEDEPQALMEFLGEDVSRPIFLRPSINYFLVRLWHDDRDRFWDVLWTLQTSGDPHVRLIARVLPTAVVVSEAREVSDLDPLIGALESGRAGSPTAALRVLQGLRGLGSPRDEMWASVATRVSPHLHQDFAWEFGVWLGEVSQRADPDLEPSVAAHIGQAGRDLLVWVLEHSATTPWLDRLGAVWAVPVVVRMFSTDSAASRDLLSQVIAMVGDPQRPVDYVYRLTEEVPALWGSAPDLVSDLYVAAFEHVESSEERTAMGGIVLQLTSTRRQDFEMCQYNLVRRFPDFLDDAFTHAASAGLKAINSLVLRKHVLPYATSDDDWTEKQASIAFRDRNCDFVHDLSSIWDAPGGSPEDEQQLAQALFEHVGASETPGQDVAAFLDMFASRVNVAFLWRRLLGAAASTTNTLAAELDELLLRQVLIESDETYYEYVQLLRRRFPELGADIRKDLEQLLLELGRLPGDEHYRKVMSRRQSQLVMVLPDELISEAKVTELRRAAIEEDVAPVEPLTSFSAWSEAPDEEFWLTEQGVDIHNPLNRETLDRSTVLEEFSRTWLNDIPTAEAILEVINSVQPLFARALESKDIDPKVIETVWTRIVSVAALIVRASASLDSETLELCRTILLRAAKDPSPAEEAGLGDFSMPAWSPAPRIEAAAGLPWLAQSFPDEEVLQAIEELADDPSRAVRYVTARDLFRIAEGAPENFWVIIEQRLGTEDTPAIIDVLVASLLRVMSPTTEDRVAATITAALARSPQSTEISQQLRSALLGFALVREYAPAQALLSELVLEGESDASLLDAITGDALQIFKPSRLSTDEGRATLIRTRDLLLKLTDRAIHELKELVSHDGTNGETTPDQDRIRHLFHVLDEVVTRLYFSSGVYESSGRPTLSREEIGAFFQIYEVLLTHIAESLSEVPSVPLPASTAHRFLELLTGVVDINPRKALALASLAAELGRPSGYAFDSLAAAAVVNFVDRVLADHREIVQDDPGLGQLVGLLDMFVETGWPDAQRLVWRLEEIFR